MPNSYATLWKELYRQALEESDGMKFTDLVTGSGLCIRMCVSGYLNGSCFAHVERCECGRGMLFEWILGLLLPSYY
jgi:hypothetical protein